MDSLSALGEKLAKQRILGNLFAEHPSTAQKFEFGTPFQKSGVTGWAKQNLRNMLPLASKNLRLPVQPQMGPWLPVNSFELIAQHPYFRQEFYSPPDRMFEANTFGGNVGGPSHSPIYNNMLDFLRITNQFNSHLSQALKTKQATASAAAPQGPAGVSAPVLDSEDVRKAIVQAAHSLGLGPNRGLSPQEARTRLNLLGMLVTDVLKNFGSVKNMKGQTLSTNPNTPLGRLVVQALIGKALHYGGHTAGQKKGAWELKKGGFGSL